MEGLPEPTWWKARTWSQLLGNICSYTSMANNLNNAYTVNSQVLAYTPD